jgi:hypothetical protein
MKMSDKAIKPQSQVSLNAALNDMVQGYMKVPYGQNIPDCPCLIFSSEVHANTIRETAQTVWGMMEAAMKLGEMNDRLSGAMEELSIENRRYRDALREIAKCLRPDEVQEEGHYINDYDFAYDQIVALARHTLNPDMLEELGKGLQK